MPESRGNVDVGVDVDVDVGVDVDDKGKKECFGKKSKNTFGFLRPAEEFGFPFFSCVFRGS